MGRILRSALPCLVMSVSLQACTSSAIDKEADTPGPSAAPAGVTLVLVATHASGLPPSRSADNAPYSYTREGDMSLTHRRVSN